MLNLELLTANKMYSQTKYSDAFKPKTYSDCRLGPSFYIYFSWIGIQVPLCLCLSTESLKANLTRIPVI